MSKNITVGLSKESYWSKNGWASTLGISTMSKNITVGLSKESYWSKHGWASTLGLTNLSVSVKVDLKKNWSGSVQEWVNAHAKGGIFSNSVWHDLPQYAGGGVVGKTRWSSIPQYADGSNNVHGSLFLAGEAGPELVGHVGGRTEVLNRSQLAATMYSAVRAAMSGVRIAGTMYSGSVGSDDDYETMYRAMYDAFTDAMAGSNERDREKVALMRQIAAKDFTAEVTAASVNRAQTRMNRRAGTTIVPVGT